MKLNQIEIFPSDKDISMTTQSIHHRDNFACMVARVGCPGGSDGGREFHPYPAMRTFLAKRIIAGSI
jgi:hypothetical protein